MTYFCAKCQRRHPIEDISADMWSICRNELAQNLENMITDLKASDSEPQSDEERRREDTLSNFESTLTSMINSEEPIQIDTEAFHGYGRVNACFPLNRRSVDKNKGAHIEDRLITCTFSITLDELVNVCLAVNEGKTDENQSLLAGKEAIGNSRLRQSLYTKDVRMFLNKHGALDHVTDRNNEPFPDEKKKMHGFTKICPHCGSILSGAAGWAEEIVVALAGSSRFGKSSSMVAMINTILSGRNPYFRVPSIPQDQYWNKLKDEIEAYRYCEKTKKTEIDLVDVPFYSLPIQICDQTNTERVLTIVDMAGEFWTGEDGVLSAQFFAKYSRLYENLDCIWYVTSKAAVRVSGTYPPPDERVFSILEHETSETREIIQRSNAITLGSNLSLLKGQLSATIKKPIPPTAVIVTKPDYCMSEIDFRETRGYRLFPVGSDEVSQINFDDLNSLFGVHDNMLVINERNLRSSALLVRNFIADKYSNLIHAIEDNCPMRFYAVLSPYGRAALERRTPEERLAALERDRSSVAEPQPFHELFPLIWTLAITGTLPVFHDVNWQTRNFVGRITANDRQVETVKFDYRQQVASRQSKQSDQDKMRENIVKNLMIQTEQYQETYIAHKRR